MPTTLTLTPQPSTASVLVQIAGAPGPSTAYSYGFEPAGVDSWSAAGGASVSRATLFAISGAASLGLSIPTGTVAGATAARTITGLTVGLQYRLRAKVRPLNSAAHVRPRVTGMAAGATTTQAGSAAVNPVSYTFTATATSHVITFETVSDYNGPAGTSVVVLIDDVVVESLPSGYRPLTISRLDANGNGPVRMLDGQEPNAGSLVVTDYEPALTGTITYTVTDGLGVVVTASTSLGGLVALPWLGVPVMPQLGRAVPMILDDYAASQDSRGVLHQVIGRADPVPSLASLGTRSGSLSVLVETHQEARLVAGVYDRGQVVHLRQPTHAGLDMHHVGTRVNVRPEGERWRVSIDYTEVARPVGPLLGGLGWDFASVAGRYADFAAVRAAFPDFASLTVGPL